MPRPSEKELASEKGNLLRQQPLPIIEIPYPLYAFYDLSSDYDTSFTSSTAKANHAPYPIVRSSTSSCPSTLSLKFPTCDTPTSVSGSLLHLPEVHSDLLGGLFAMWPVTNTRCQSDGTHGASGKAFHFAIKQS